MKTSDSIEQQGERKAARDNRNQGDSSPACKPPAGQKLKQRDATRIAAWRFQLGQSGNPTGKAGRHDLAAEIACAAFENNAQALYKAFSKAMLKGNAFAYKELADRAYGKLKERIEVEAGPLRNMSDDDLKTRIAELEAKLGLVPALPPVGEDSNPTKPQRCGLHIRCADIAIGESSTSMALCSNYAVFRGFPMYCVSVNLTSSEWLEIQQAASKQWPSENLSRAEVVRRYALLGIQFPKYVSPRDIARASERLQASRSRTPTSGCAIDPPRPRATILRPRIPILMSDSG